MLLHINMAVLTLKSRLKRLIKRINDDDVFGRAAQLSYYFLLALFPLLLVLINLLGFMAQQGTEFRVKLISLSRCGDAIERCCSRPHDTGRNQRCEWKWKVVAWFAGCFVGGLEWNGGD